MTMYNHPWHDIAPGEPDQLPDVVNAIIEIPKGSKAKFEIHKDSGVIMLDRVLFSAVHYPTNYGFIPQTLGEDGDPLDILVIMTVDVPPLCLVKAKVLGVMRMRDQGEADDKIIAVAQHDMSVNHINTISELPPHTIVEVRRFFEDYKKLENKEVLVEDFLDKPTAVRILQESIDLYKATYPKA